MNPMKGFEVTRTETVEKNAIRKALLATLHPTLSVRRSVGWSLFYFSMFLRSFASLLLPKCSSNSNWGSLVSGLVYLI